MTDDTQLHKELREAGASKREVRDLLPIAARLNRLPKEQRLEPSRVHWLGVAQPVAYAALGIAFGVFLIIFSQAAVPGSWLYPVQKMSDSAVVKLRPQYRATVMMKRAQQVNQLVASHASSGTVMATLADYSRVAGAYKAAPNTNYAAFEFCESNLKQASASASPEVQKAIATSLNYLEAS